MNIADYYKNRNKPVISFEIFPPKTVGGLENLKKTLEDLSALSPDFITVTYGAMGTTRDKTVEIASYIKNTLKIETACHLTCVGSTRDEISTILNKIKESGINNIVALRGDPPAGEKHFTPPEGGMAYANELVEHIRQYEKTSKNNAYHFGIAIAGYPEKHIEANNFDEDLTNLKRKVDAGADIIITQLFFDNRYYFDYVERVRSIGINIPIVPGLMPILSSKQIMKISSMCGSYIPETLKDQLIQAGDNNALAEEIGITQCVKQAKELLAAGVPGIHFYVLNKALHIKRILQSL
ncbi:MAG: methylenetetrahydrofolate reductase [NAD(P)H] [Candidatus Dadabacteria bacterium]|nr:methylenetetrahydrofolate reductase [NAD(P)H] [Candidatus Dadabacteria bacterium]NIQ15065.1 methylenetetrahydrofolate reductase [NAD(P)H] [Candidatus Dadabacteria bacterium]